MGRLQARHSAVVQFNALAAQAQPVLLEKLGPLVGPSGCGERPTLSQPRRAEQHGRGQSFVAVSLVDTHVRDVKALFGRYEIGGKVRLGATELPGLQNPLLITGVGRGTIEPDLVSLLAHLLHFGNGLQLVVYRGHRTGHAPRNRQDQHGPAENPASKNSHWNISFSAEVPLLALLGTSQIRWMWLSSRHAA